VSDPDGAVEPTREQLTEMAELAAGADDGPLVMLNLNRYRDREAYARYGAVALKVLERVGGRVLWHAEAHEPVIGDDRDACDEVIAVWYPSAAAFLALAGDPEILAARADRVAGLERAALIRCAAGPEPTLGV
jgi:uncharacterized protein (DUF1330 family)